MGEHEHQKKLIKTKNVLTQEKFHAVTGFVAPLKAEIEAGKYTMDQLGEAATKALEFLVTGHNMKSVLKSMHVEIADPHNGKPDPRIEVLVMEVGTLIARIEALENKVGR